MESNTATATNANQSPASIIKYQRPIPMQCPKLIVLLNTGLNPYESTNFTTPGLVSSSLYTANNSQALLGYIDPDQDINSIISKFRAHYGEHGNNKTEWRLYEPLSAHPKDMTPPLVPHILVYNAMSTHPESEEDFNNWYNDEHIPLLCQTPSWLYSRRYTLIACRDHDLDTTPRYLALHSWASWAVFDAPAYKSAIDTPWRTRVIGKLTKRERIVFDYVDDVRAQEQAKTAISAILASV